MEPLLSGNSYQAVCHKLEYGKISEKIKSNKRKIGNLKEGITYRTSTVLTCTNVEGIVPLRLFPSNNLSQSKTKVQRLIS